MRGEFAAFAAATSRTMNGCYVLMNKVLKRNGRDVGYRQDDRRPVACVNWHDAPEFSRAAKRIGIRTDRRNRATGFRVGRSLH